MSPTINAITAAPKIELVATSTFTAAPVNSGKPGLVALPLAAGGAADTSVEDTDGTTGAAVDEAAGT